MKKLFVLTTVLIGLSASAQEVTPLSLGDFMALRLSSDGLYCGGQDRWGSCVVYNTEDGKIFYYTNFYPGGGQFVADNGWAVGQSMDGMQGVVMINGQQPVVPAVLNQYASSVFESVTPDATRACGWLTNPGRGPVVIPFFVDIDETGNISEPVILPYPDKDFFETTPQYCTAGFISDDGRVIAGQVTDGSGFYCYPIVYRMNENDEWEYYLPSEKLFNPNGLPIPQWPDENFMPPNPVDYMDEESAEEWERLVAEQKEPWSRLDEFMTPEKWAEYNDAMDEYWAKMKDFNEGVDRYWREMAQLSQGARFTMGAMALNPQGTMIAIPGVLTEEETTTDIATGYQLYQFDLVNDSYSFPAPDATTMAIPYQMMEDGTIISVSQSNYRGYLILPESGKYIPLEEYLETSRPEWLPWMRANLSQQTTVFNPATGQYEDATYLASGVISFNREMTIMSGGFFDGENTSSYIFGAAKSGVEELTEDIVSDQVYVVFNLQGVKVLETKDAGRLKELPKGVYVVNGKKVIFK